MKYKNYGNNNNEYTDGSGVELLSVYDPLAGRSVNRPLVNLYENQEETYKLLNTLLKTVYGETGNSIVPELYEEFTPEGFTINSFKNDAKRYFLRVPTGMMFINKNKKISPHEDKSKSPFFKHGEFDYQDTMGRDGFSKDRDYSLTYNNRPNINLLERQLADFIALDLTDLTNDIKISCDELPKCYPVSIYGLTEDFQGFDADGNLSYVTDNNGNFLYICEKDEDADFYLENVKAEIKDIEYNFNPKGNNDDFFKHNKKGLSVEKFYNYYIKLNEGEDPILKKEAVGEKFSLENPDVAGYVPLTKNFDKAIKVKDFSGNIKKNLGYYAKITRTTETDDEVSYLPNKKQNAYWDICLPETGDMGEEFKENEYVFRITLNNESGTPLTYWEFMFFGYASETLLNNMLFNKILTEGYSYFTVSKYQFENAARDVKHGVRISFLSEANHCNNYGLTIECSKNKGDFTVVKNIDTGAGWPENKINNVKPYPAEKQKYYNNIFELTNAFLGKFSSYQIDINNIYNYLAGETILKLPQLNSFSIYYDTNVNKTDNGEDSSYDKSGKLYITTSKNVKNKNLILLFDVEIERPSSVLLAPKIKYIKSYIKTLDRRILGSKRSEFDSLLVNARTELNNHVVIKDNGENRVIEMIDDFTNEPDNKEQIRIYSPITRITTDNKVANDKQLEWERGTGDSPSDFRDEYVTRNYITDETKNNYHLNNDMGIIIDNNKGIKIYNNDIDATDGEHNSYSDLKPIEITNRKGNINILGTESDFSRIGIKNLNDSSNNIIDNLGVTRIRSKQDKQLIIRKIEKYNDENSKGAAIAFVQGESTPDTNIDALSHKKGEKTNEPEDLILGSIEFRSGKEYLSSDKEKPNENPGFNRSATIKLLDTDSMENISSVLEMRNANSGLSKKVVTIFGDIVGNAKNNSIGFPLKSRTYAKDTKAIIPYSDSKAEVNVNLEGTSTEYIKLEDRWHSLFVDYGYLNKLTLADREIDRNNSDSRNGNLRLGNGNIYDVSSIYINCDDTTDSSYRNNMGTINFDNSYNVKKENTIYSVGDKENTSSMNFIIDRELGFPHANSTQIENIYVKEEKSNDIKSTGFNALKLSLEGAEVGKSLKVNRQAFINMHDNSTYKDNNVFSVRGQSIFNGEIVLGTNLFPDEKWNISYNNFLKENPEPDLENIEEHEKWEKLKAAWDLANGEKPKAGIINMVDYSKHSVNSYEQEKDPDSNPNKKYNEEFIGDYDELIYTFRNYGRSYFDHDITVNSNKKFTENTNFDKRVVIRNNAWNDSSYNNLSGKNHRYYTNVDEYTNDDYDIESGTTSTISRHHTSLDVLSGTILLGSEKMFVPGKEDMQDLDYDPCDLKLFGSGWIKRRLEINSDGPLLEDTYVNKGSLYNIDENPSPTFLVSDGLSLFNGDVVFGGELNEAVMEPCEKNSNLENITYKYAKHHRKHNEKEEFKPVKVILWGKNFVREEGEIVPYNSNLSLSDFDFHGEAWFDNAVRIGCNNTDDNNEDSIDNRGRLSIRGESSLIFDDPEQDDDKNRKEWGLNRAALRVDGSVSLCNEGGESDIYGDWLRITGSSLEDSSGRSVNIYVNGDSEDKHSKEGSMFVNVENKFELFSSPKREPTDKSEFVNKFTMDAKNGTKFDVFKNNFSINNTSVEKKLKSSIELNSTGIPTLKLSNYYDTTKDSAKKTKAADGEIEIIEPSFNEKEGIKSIIEMKEGKIDLSSSKNNVGSKISMSEKGTEIQGKLKTIDDFEIAGPLTVTAESVFNNNIVANGLSTFSKAAIGMGTIDNLTVSKEMTVGSLDSRAKFTESYSNKITLDAASTLEITSADSTSVRGKTINLASAAIEINGPAGKEESPSNNLSVNIGSNFNKKVVINDTTLLNKKAVYDLYNSSNNQPAINVKFKKSGANNYFGIGHCTDDADNSIRFCSTDGENWNGDADLSIFFIGKLFGAVWNDLVDKIDVPENTELEYGKCYVFDGENYIKSSKYAQQGFVGIHSDTYGLAMGQSNNKQLNSAVAGYVLACVDKEYPAGTPLTCTKDGNLTKAGLYVRIFHSDRIIGNYWKKESGEEWNGIKVNNRKWIKIR